MFVRSWRGFEKERPDAEERDVVPLRSSQNHMDPCFRFPWDDLQALFAGATVTEAMLVATDGACSNQSYELLSLIHI